MSEQACLLAPQTRPVPGFVPAQWRSELAGRTVSDLRLPLSVRQRLRTPERIRVSEHAARYRQVTDGLHTGAWRHELAPHTVKIMDTYGLPWVREIWYCAVEQSGKTATMTNCMQWAVDCDPGDVFYLMPTEQTAVRVMAGKIIPMIRQSERLGRYLTGRDDDLGLQRISFKHGVTIRPAWANSAASMATFSAKHNFGDEVDKYPLRAGAEASPIVLIRKRGRLYKGASKCFFASTPGEARFIWRGVQSCQQVWTFALRCPHCGELVRPTGEQLVLPEKAEPDSLTAEQVGLACGSCGAVWDEIDRERAIRAGRWLCSKGAELARPRTVGFHHRAWDCLDVPLHEIAAAWLRAKGGTVADKVAWANGYEATDFEEEQQDRKEDEILRLVDDSQPREVVPAEVCCLVLLADTQRIGFHYEVWALGWGPDVPIWLIDHNYVEHFANLVDLAGKSWLSAGGVEHRIGAAFIDSGGGTNPDKPKHSRTVEVYDFCRHNPLFKPLKGRRTMVQPWNVTRLDFYPSRAGKKIPIPGGLNLYTINVTAYKNELSRKLLSELGAPGGITLHAGTGEDYARQMCAEYQDERGHWVCPRNKPNHHWDLGVYGVAAADILMVRNMRRPGEQSVPARRVISRGVRI